MAYCDKDDLVEALGETKLREIIGLTDGTATSFPDAGETAAITKAIADADAKIDIYCIRYELPLVGTAADYVTPISMDLTEWNLRNDRNVMTDECQNKYDKWENALELITEKKAGIPGANTPTSAGGIDFISGNELVFGRDKMEGF